jgi:hypothetical protein
MALYEGSENIKRENKTEIKINFHCNACDEMNVGIIPDFNDGKIFQCRRCKRKFLFLISLVK